MSFWSRWKEDAPALATAGHPRVYAVPPGQPFLVALAQALSSGSLPEPTGRRPGALELASTTLYLPTRRTTRALQEAFLKPSAGSALLLPRIKAISEGNEDLDLIASADDYAAAGEAAVPRVVSELQRRLVLTSLVLHWGGSDRASREALDAVHSTAARTPAQAAKLAKELARLIDSLETEAVDPARLKSLVPEEYSEHWSRTLAFLQVITEFWPAHLAENNLISPVGRRQRLLQAEVQRLAARPAETPVIVAGVTSADAAAAELIRAVLALPNGALVLPALDQALDEESWALIDDHPEHPQHGLKKLLDTLGITRADVRPLAAGGAPAQEARWALACEAMRPARTTERWHPFTSDADKKHMAAALTGLSMIEASTAEEEAEVIALMLREAAETPGRTARLITPDRSLARRVAARLAVWDIQVEDEAGVPFGRTLPGVLLDLVAAVVEKDFEPVALMSLLKHPLCRLGMPASELRRGISTLELAAFRGPYFGKGLQGVEATLEGAGGAARRNSALRKLSQPDWQAARHLVRRLMHVFEPLAEAFAGTEPASVRELASLHYATAQALAKSSDEDDGAALRHGEAGEWAAQFFASLIDTSMPAPDMVPVDYPDFYRTLVADKFIRTRASVHPRLSISDPGAARLQHTDLVVLGSLNEGTWPGAADPGPWLSRPMRKTLGLPAPEEVIGAGAHDFVSQLSAGQVVLTRAAKVDGSPTVPSRLLLRLQALVKGLGLNLAPERPWIAWAQARSAHDGPVRPVRAPEPRPALVHRPRELSVSAIETWIANPYAIFAQRILKLEPLPLLAERPGAALRGQVVHEALNRFAQRHPERLPADPAGELVAMAEAVLADYTSNPRVAAFWAPRFARFAGWFAETEPARRAGMIRTIAEAAGKLVLTAPAGPFTLTARADRIDVGNGGLAISDYKSSQSLQPLASKAVAGEAPQLPLEAAIAHAAGFANVPPGRVTLLRYISTAGGEPPGQDVPLRVDDLAAYIQGAQDGLARLVADFDRADTPYRAVRRARFRYDYDAYAHLARVAEWSVDTAEEE